MSPKYCPHDLNFHQLMLIFEMLIWLIFKESCRIVLEFTNTTYIIKDDINKSDASLRNFGAAFINYHGKVVYNYRINWTYDI